MTDIQSALTQAITEWEQGANATPQTKQVSVGVSKATFDHIKNNPTKTKSAVIRELEERGYKPSSTTTLISAMVRQGIVHMTESKRLKAVAESYAPLKARKKFAAKAASPGAQGIAALPITASAPVTARGFDVDALIDSLTLRQAMVLRKRLNDMWIGEQA
jgi:hypothetical protein